MDKAELKRVFQIILKEGKNEIVIEDVSKNILSNTIRIDIKNKTKATIQEVNFQKDQATPEEIDSEKVCF